MMEKTELNLNYITFGKYKDKDLLDLLKDRKYCAWLIEEDWFKESYEYLYNSLIKYDPKKYFFSDISEREEDDLVENYKYFNLIQIPDLKIKLNEKELFCYSFYLKMIDKMKNDIKKNIIMKKKNTFNILILGTKLHKLKMKFSGSELINRFLYSIGFNIIP